MYTTYFFGGGLFLSVVNILGDILVRHSHNFSLPDVFHVLKQELYYSWRYKMSIGVLYNLFLGEGLFLGVVNILGSLLTQLSSARCLSRYGTRDIFLVIKNKSYIILVVKMIYYE